MAKFKKAALVCVLAAVAAVSLMFVGCSSGGAEIDGTYHYSSVNPVTIEQGRLIRTTQESMTIFTDNTFAAGCVNDTLYSSDGTSYNPTYFAFCNIYGTYEVVNEDDILNERTIKITDITMVVTEAGSFAQESFTAEQNETVDSTLVGKEILLTSDYEIADGLGALSIRNAFGE